MKTIVASNRYLAITRAIPNTAAVPEASSLAPGASHVPSVGLPHIEAGKLRALGLSGARKPASLSQFPTVAESGLPGFDENTWYGIFGPAGLPPAILNKLNADLVKVLSSPELKERFAQQGQEMVGNSPERFREIVKAEVAKWAEVIKETGLHID